MMEQRPALLLLAVFAVFASFVAVSNVASGDGEVTVTASVAETVTCATNISSTAFGTLTDSSVHGATPNASTSLSCNTGLGCTLTVGDQGNGSSPGLATTSPANLIASADAAPLSVGSEGYGIQATTTAAAGSGAALLVNSKYNVGGDNVGGLTVSSTPTTLASTTGQTSGKSVEVTHKATIAGDTQAGSYSDIITYSCTAN